MAVAASYEQRRVARQMRDGGYTWSQIAHELRTRYGINGLTACRQAHGWSQDQAAAAWCRRWPGETKTYKDISRWETGDPPRAWVLGRLAELYSVSASELLAGWSDFSDPEWPNVDWRYDPNVDRRQFLSSIAVAGAATALPATRGVRVGAADVEALRDHLWMLWHQDEALGGGAVYRAVTAQLAAVQELRAKASFGPTVGRDLQVLAGRLTELCGFTAYDAGEHDLARRQFHEALAVARMADDSEFEVYVLAQLANQASYLRHGVEVVDLTQAAQRIARGFARPRLVAVLASREAEGHGLRGDTSSAQVALTRAEQEMADAGDDADAWFAYFTPEMLAVSSARTWLALGAPVMAERCARDSVTTGLARRPQAMNCVTHARTLVGAGRLDEAAAVTVDAVELADGVSSARMRSDLRSLRPALEGHESVPGVPAALHALASV